MQRALTYSLEPSGPSVCLPSGACDAHVHVFGPAARFPFASDSAINPADAPKEALFALHRHLGIGRCVIVQSLVHGFDNRVVEDAISAGGGRYLGVALVPWDVQDSELARLAAAGFRGVRFNFMSLDVLRSDAPRLAAFTRRLAPLGMHLQVHFESAFIHLLAPELERSAVPVVIDHMARVDASLGTAHPDFGALHALMKNPLMHVKVSGIDRVTRTADYSDGIVLARVLVNDFADRCFWGSDWPHPNHTHVPDDGRLVDALAEIAPRKDLLQSLMVDNPLSFYRFAA